MPIYLMRCEQGHEAEVLRSVANRDNPSICGDCTAPSHRVMAAFHTRVDDTPAFEDDGRTYGDRYHERMVNASRPAVIERSGGGRAVKVQETNGYRPACTHNTRCPQGHWANVAILSEQAPWGKRLNCDRCGYVWLYNAETAEYPLREGYDKSFAAPLRFGADMAKGGERYEYGPRGR